MKISGFKESKSGAVLYVQQEGSFVQITVETSCDETIFLTPAQAKRVRDELEKIITSAEEFVEE